MRAATKDGNHGNDAIYGTYDSHTSHNSHASHNSRQRMMVMLAAGNAEIFAGIWGVV